MRRLLLAIAASLVLIPVVSAQHAVGHNQAPPPFEPETRADQEYAVREKLIKAYVPKYAWGVSMCGEEDDYSGESYSWLCVYVYKDTLKEFATALMANGAEIRDKLIFVEGVPLQFTLIERPKQ
jgi:hypothetical protein